MTNAEKVINWAILQENKKAKDFNYSTDWCALFVSKALTQAGYTLKNASTYSCTAQMKHFKDMGIWHDGITGIDKGCIVYYDWDMSGDCDHVGIIWDKQDNTMWTIEGNTCGGVWRETSVNIMVRNVFSNLIRGYVKLSDIFNEPAKITPIPVYYGKRYVNKDNAGKCELIQHMLNVTNNAGLSEDGILGDKTDTAIKDFQRKYKLEIDGIVGDETLFKLTQLYFNIPLENFKIGC